MIYLAFPMFTAYALNGYAAQKRTVANYLARLLPEPVVKVNAPSASEVTVTEQEGWRMVHILYYIPERRTPDLDVVEDVVPLHNVKVALQAKSRPSRVYLAPQKTDLSFEYADGCAKVTVPEVHGHQMAVFES